MSFANFISENSDGIHQSRKPTWNGQDWNYFWKFFTFENLSTWAGRPWELSHLKNLCIFPPPFIFHSQGSACFILPSFECAFEPSTIKGSAFPILPPLECAFEPSPHFFSSAPSSPRPSKVVRFLTLPPFEYALEPSFQHASKPSFPSSFHLLNSAPSSPIRPLLKNPRIFPPLAGNPLQCDHFWKILAFFHWAGNPLQCDHFWKIILVFFHWAGNPLQCDHFLKNPRIFPLGR